MKNSIALIATVLVCLGMCTGVSAAPITITPDSGVLDDTRYEGAEFASTRELRGIVGDIVGDLPELWKAEVGDASDPSTTYEGPLAGNYSATFSNSAGDPSDVLIEYLGGAVVGPEAWLVIKDGNNAPYWYLFNLTALGWDGESDITVEGFWPGEGAISHVALVPEPGTLALLGLGLIGFAVARRGLATH